MPPNAAQCRRMPPNAAQCRPMRAPRHVAPAGQASRVCVCSVWLALGQRACAGARRQTRALEEPNVDTKELKCSVV